MKKALSILFICFLITFSSFTQEKKHHAFSNPLFDKIYDSLRNKSDGNYISAFFIKGRILEKRLLYLSVNNKNLLIINYGDTLLKIKEITGGSLFTNVLINLKNLKKAENYTINHLMYHYYNNFNDFADAVNKNKQEYSDTSNIHDFVGIKYNKHNFNHFQKFSEETIVRIKNKRLKAGMNFINYLCRVLQEAEKK